MDALDADGVETDVDVGGTNLAYTESRLAPPQVWLILPAQG